MCPGAVPIAMSQRAGEAVSYLFSPAPSMASSRAVYAGKKKERRKVGLSDVGTGKISALLTDEAWIDADNPLPASLFSTKKKERSKAGVSAVGTGKISALCFSLGLISTFSTCGSAGKIGV
ncbi:hypothetical protein QYE76_029063 [Lolium multiflorum]|uniref:Uncharacterized protein n=1 Tax=Lolium multiflorum TaxID=4521 RepID=A0AAD8VHV0_LOLMU|nr:hypothetical protein QYE76_029063 [Lolium multiflorum]